MNAKTFLFVAAWMKPLKTLPLEQRWNVIEAITEYATTGQITPYHLIHREKNTGRLKSQYKKLFLRIDFHFKSKISPFSNLNFHYFFLTLHP